MKKKLIQKLKWLSKRSDLNIHSCKIRPPADEKILQEKAKYLPAQLIELYKAMNGCFFIASVVNNQDLYLGLTIPPIESIQGFHVGPNPKYNFSPDVQFLPFEWSESTESTFFFVLKAEDKDIEHAKIVYARAAEESQFKVVCNSLEEWIEKAIAANFSLGWALENATIYQSNKVKLQQLLVEQPKKKTSYAIGTRLRFENFRVTVVDLIHKESNSFGSDFVLIDFDLGARGWAKLGSLKKIRSKDFYEKIKMRKLLLDEMTGKQASEEIAQNFAAICCSNTNISIAPKNTTIPYHSSTLVGLFSDFSLQRMTEIVFGLLDGWYEVFDQNLNQKFPFDKVKSRIKMKEYLLSNLFHALLGVLIFRVIRERKSEGKELAYLTKIQSMLHQRKQNYVSNRPIKFNNYYFDKFLENIDLVFTSDEIVADSWFEKKISPYYLKEIGLADYPFYLNPRA